MSKNTNFEEEIIFFDAEIIEDDDNEDIPMGVLVNAPANTRLQMSLQRKSLQIQHLQKSLFKKISLPRNLQRTKQLQKSQSLMKHLL